MKKLPWGIFAGVLFVLVFYITIGIVAAYLILNGIAGATSGSITLFTNWWQSLLFAADIVFGVLLIGCFVMFILKKVGVLDRLGKTKSTGSESTESTEAAATASDE